MAKLILFLLFLPISFSAHSQTGTVILNVRGVQPNKGGELSAGIFQRENFPKVGRQLIGTEKPVTGNPMQIILGNVPPGSYGVVVFQDIDRNKNLRTNLVGLPTEPIGFSNDARIKLGPPAFDDAKITVEKDQTTTLSIILR